MKTFNSELYGFIPEPESFLELLGLITHHETKSITHTVYMWRGQDNIEWRLDHAAYRRLKLTKKRVEEHDLISYEKNLLKQATHKGHRFQNGRLLTDFELLAKLQHHGAATRLLDFTRNSLIALWFSISGSFDKYGLLIGLHVNELGGYESEDENEEYENQINSINKLFHPQTWEPPVITARIAAQHSQFIYSALSDDKRSSIRLSEGQKANLFIAISPSLKNILATTLEKSFDLRYQTLFPDIDGFGNANATGVSVNAMWRW